MLRLIARYADIWNMVASPDEFAAGNQRLDEACAAIGRDPSTLVRAVSPRLNLLVSVDAFADGVAAYRAAGVDDIHMPWPRTEREVPVLRQVAREVMPELRGEQAAAGESGPAAPRQGDVAAADAETVRRAYAAIGEADARRVLDFLIDHPDERFDGRALMQHLEIERHDDVTRAIVNVAATLAEHGLARPWNEAQAGYLLPDNPAAALARAREAVREGSL
jgi:hypothetical protein